MESVNLTGVDLSKCNMEQTNILIDIKTSTAAFAPCVARSCSVDRLKRQGGRALRTPRRRPHLRRSSGRNLSGMVLRETKLRGANLSKCILALTDLTNADMENANLSGAALLGTNFRGANLARAKLQNAIFRSMEIMDKVGKPTGTLSENGSRYGKSHRCDRVRFRFIPMQRRRSEVRNELSYLTLMMMSSF